MKIAVLDDYQNVAFTYADWSNIRQRAEVTVFNDHLADKQAVIQRLGGFQVVCVMRERTPLDHDVLSRLPELKLIVSTGKRNTSIALKACEELNIEVRHTGYHETGAPELTWALLMNIARKVNAENLNLRNNEWQQTVGVDLAGKVIGIVGLGRIGSRIARYAKAFEMKVMAWSQNLTEVQAHRAGAELVTKEQLFKMADFVTLHLVLSDRTRHIVGETELSAMRSSAFIVNTSRGPLIDEQALIKVLSEQKIAGAALDTYDMEPLPLSHPFRELPNVLATPHIGYVTEDTYKVFYLDTVAQIEDWLEQQAG